MLLFQRYIKICDSTYTSWSIYAPHLSSLEAVFKMHCLYANAVVQPSMKHCAIASFRFLMMKEELEGTKAENRF